MSVRESRARMRGILAGSRCVEMASVFDPISARLAQQLGFEAGLMGGSIVSHVVLGAPDLILLTLSELAEQVHRCTRAADVPILVDADHGYGNALNVMRTIRELDDAGAAAAMIEDTALPRPYGKQGAQQLLPLDESLGKIRAAVAARGDSDFIVLGRTSAATLVSVDEAIARFRAYEAEGVDALFLPGLGTREQLDRVADAVTVPLVVGAPAEPLCDQAYLTSRRVRLWSAGHQTFNVAVKALADAMKAVRDGAAAWQLPNGAPKALLDRITDATSYDQATRRFLGGE